MVKTSAVKRKGKYVINGEKWFVTSANASSIILVHAHVDGDPDKPTLFIVDRDQAGVKKKRVPQLHAQLRFRTLGNPVRQGGG